MTTGKPDTGVEGLYHGTLKNGAPVTMVPFASKEVTPEWVKQELQDLLNDIIIEGKTYPIEEVLNRKAFEEYYLPKFVAVLFDGHVTSHEEINDHAIIGAFYIKPNYVGRSSHVCNGGFIVNPEFRGLGAGELMGRIYLRWAPQLGYTSSIFNLVYSNNVGSYKIWDKLGFTRLATVPKVGRLNGSAELVDAYVYGYSFD